MVLISRVKWCFLVANELQPGHIVHGLDIIICVPKGPAESGHVSWLRELREWLAELHCFQVWIHHSPLILNVHLESQKWRKALWWTVSILSFHLTSRTCLRIACLVG